MGIILGVEQPDECVGIKTIDCASFAPEERITEDVTRYAANHSRNDLIELEIDGAALFKHPSIPNLPFYKRVRTFNILTIDTINRNYSKLIASARYISGDKNQRRDCYTLDLAQTSAISESYETRDTEIYLYDPRNGNVIFRTIKESISFTGESNGLTETFLQEEGWVKYAVIAIPEVVKQTEVSWICYMPSVWPMVVNLGSTSYETVVKQDLNIVYPNPPYASKPATTGFNFYDYNEYPDGSDWGPGRTGSDGGKDFFWPEWCRACGTNNAIDLALKNDRIQKITQTINAIRNGDPVPSEADTTPLAIRKEVFSYRMPIGNVQQDVKGNIIVSATGLEAKGTAFKKVDNTYEATELIDILTKRAPPYHDSTAFYPIGLI